MAVENLVALLVPFMERYLRRVRKLVLDAHARDLGRDTLGSVEGREESEDVYLGIDEESELEFTRECAELHQEHGLKIWIRSEHHQKGYGVGCNQKRHADVECDLDPFDGTAQYALRLQESWWSVGSFSRKGVPIVGGAVDILAGTIYLAHDDRVEEISIRSNRHRRVFPRDEISLSGASVVASYKGRWKYLFPWVELMEGVFSQESLKGINHNGNGGTPAYPWLAAAVTSAYVMPEGEPISEISPGAAFVRSAGLYLGVLRGNELEPFNPVAGMKGRVDGVFIAACTEELAHDIADRIRKFGNRCSRKLSSAA